MNLDSIVEIHSTLNRSVSICRPSRRSCSANVELVVRLTLNYPRFGSRNSELSLRCCILFIYMDALRGLNAYRCWE